MSRTPLLLALLLLLPFAAADEAAPAKRTPRPVCQGGRFVLPTGTPPLLPGGATPEVIVLDDTGSRPAVSLASGCAPTAATLKATKRGTTLAATWKRCGTLRKARLAGRFDAQCATLSATFKARKEKRRRIAATRSACGDGILDSNGGEQCEAPGAACAAGSFCADCRCVSDVFSPMNAYGGPPPPDARIVTPDELEQQVRNGGEIVTLAGLAAAEAEETARIEADRRIVAAAIARDPRIGNGLQLTPPPNARPSGGSIEIDLSTPAGSRPVVLHGSEFLMRATAAALRKFPTRGNQELMYRTLYDALPPDQREGLPAPDELTNFSDEAVSDLRAEVVRRADDALPNTGPPEADPGVSSNGGLTQATSECTPSFYGLRQQTTWPLEGYTTAVKDQGGRGTCAAHGAAAGLEAYLWKFKGRPVIDLSEQDLYGRAKGRWFPSAYSEGIPTENLIEELDERDVKVRTENAWLYNPSWDRVEDDDDETYSNSCANYGQTCSNKNHQLGLSCTTLGGSTTCVRYTHPELTGDSSTTHELRDYVSLWNGFEPENSLQNVRTYLAAGYPVVFAFNLDDQFVDANKDDPWVTNPNGDDIGGHAVLMVGYKSGAFVENIPVGAPQGYGAHFYIIKNSWGCDYGDAGYVYVHADWVIEHAKSATAIVGSATSGLPSISLAASKSLVTSGGTVNLGAAGNNLERVDFYEGFTKIRTDLSAPFVHAITYDGADNSTHYYFARGYDPVGDFVDSNVVEVKVDIDDVPPTVALLGPQTVPTPPGNVTVTAVASDNKGVTKVEFFRRKLIPAFNGGSFELLTKLGESYAPPYAFPLQFGAGAVGDNSFKAVASDAAGNKGKSLPFTLTVVPLLKPIVPTFTATPATLPVGGGQVTLEWSVAGASTVTIDNGVGTVTGLTSKTVSVTQSTTFTLTASNAQGSTTRIADVNVLVPIKPFIQSFTATPDTLPAGGGQVTLAWAVLGEDTLSIDAGVGDVTGLDQTGVSVAATTTFTLTAGNQAGSSTRQVTVAVASSTTTTTVVTTTTTSTTGATTSSTTTPTTTSTTTTVVTGGVDLAPISFSASAAELVPGQPLSVSFAVRNLGGAPATGTWLDQIWLSSNGTIGLPGDLFLGNVIRMGPLAPGAVFTTTNLPVSIPANKPAGDYYLLLRTDPQHVIAETDEANNDWPTPTPIRLVTPDLVPTSLGVAATEVDAGLQTTVSFTVKNQGKGTAFGTWLDQLWLSTDTVIDNPGDHFLANATRQKELGPDETYDVTDFSVTIPASLAVPPGKYYVMLRIDPENRIFEDTAEDNNDHPVAVPITVRAPDLTPTSFTTPSSSVTAGGTISVSFTVENQGDGTARPAWIDQLWLSTDGTIDSPGDRFLKNIDRTAPLAPGASYDVVQETIAIPAATPAGQYFLLLRANTTFQLFEAGRTANNDWPTPIPITVTAPPGP